jgi:hypothetical protein
VQVGLLPARLSLRPEQPKPVAAKTLRQVSKGKEAGSANELEEEIASPAAEADVNDLSKAPVDAEKKEDEQQGDGENEGGDAEDDEGPGHRLQDAIRLEVVNESDEAVAPFVFLESAAMKGRFSDNGFLLLPRSTRRVRFYPQAPQPGALVRKRSGNSSSSSSNESALAKERLEEEQRKRAAAFLAQCSVTSLRDAYASRSSRDLCGPPQLLSLAKEQ